MRNGRWLTIVAAALVALAGCSSSRQVKQRRMDEQIDTARRLLSSATSLLADPQYFDRITGERSPVARALGKERLDVPATGPVGRERALELLDQAQKAAQAALTDNPDAGAGLKARAQTVIGQVCLARAQCYGEQAERVRSDLGLARRRTYVHLEMLQDNASLASFADLLSQIPKESVKKLKSGAAGEVDSLQKRIARIDVQVDDLNKENDKLSAENAVLLEKAAKLRKESGAGSDAQGLSLAKQARDLSIEADAKSGRIADNQLAVETLQADQSLLKDMLKSAQIKVAVFELRGQDIDKANSNARKAAEAARERAKENWRNVEKDIADVAQLATELSGLEKPALDNFTAAAAWFDEALTNIGREIADARGRKGQNKVAQEVVNNFTDDARLGAAAAWQGTAILGRAELRSARQRTVEDNAALAEQINSSVKGLGLEGLDQTVGLLAKSYPVEPKLKGQAVQDYKDAETQFNDAASRVAGSRVRDTLWIYQGQLAGAYLGHYYLTRDAAVLNKARGFVRDALAGKEKSPYLNHVVELGRLIGELAPAGGSAGAAAALTRPGEGVESPATLPATRPAG